MDKEKLANELPKSLLKMASDFRKLAVDLQGMCVIMSDEYCEEEPQKEAEISLEQVRGLLADKSRAGHTARIREILRSFGADRLSEVDPKDYAEVLKAAEELDDE